MKKSESLSRKELTVLELCQTTYEEPSLHRYIVSDIISTNRCANYAIETVHERLVYCIDIWLASRFWNNKYSVFTFFWKVGIFHLRDLVRTATICNYHTLQQQVYLCLCLHTSQKVFSMCTYTFTFIMQLSCHVLPVVILHHVWHIHCTSYCVLSLALSSGESWS